MELKDFVKVSLEQILQGVKDAQSGPLGQNIAAEAFGNPPGGNLFSTGTYGMFTVVDFDVSIIAETKVGGGGIKVASLETIDGDHHSSQNASRIKFSVHVRLPTGARQEPNGRNSVAQTDYDPLSYE